MVRTSNSEGLTLEFALTEEQLREVNELLFDAQRRRPQDPEAGLLAVISPGTGFKRRTLLLRNLIEPRFEEVLWSRTSGLVMSHSYYSRALSAAQAVEGGGVINIHSHPAPVTGLAPPKPSKQDIATDLTELCAVSRALPVGRPTAAAIMTPGGGISVREYFFPRPTCKAEALDPKFGPGGARVMWARSVRVVGPRLRKLSADPSLPISGQMSAAMTDSSILLWGEEGQRALSRLTVGIAGLGGVGGIVAEHLARLGVGVLVLVDYDRLEMANFNRSQGAARSDALSRIPKVEVYSRIVQEAATAPNFEVRSFRESIAEEAGLTPLLNCDIIVGAADDPLARQVLDHAAYAHMIPVIDGGTSLIPNPDSMTLKAGKSQVATAGPGHPCLECQGIYTQEQATIARESAQWGHYIDRINSEPLPETLRAPSVICNNALVASLIGLRLLAIALGTTPAAICGTQRYYVEEGKLAWAATKKCKSRCTKCSWIGLGDSHWIPVGTDLRWKEIRKQEAHGGTGENEE